MLLPSFFPSAPWVEAPAGFDAVDYAGLFPPIRKLSDGRLVVDQCCGAGGVQIRVFDNCDHPNMALLPPGTPAPVLLLFRRPWQLLSVRATDAFVLFRSMEHAFAAWDRFLEGRAA